MQGLRSGIRSIGSELELIIYKKLLCENIAKQNVSIEPLVNNFSDIFYTENIVNDLFAALNQKVLLEKLKKCRVRSL